MADRKKVIERLGRVSYYFKNLLAIGWQGDADIYREHRESVNMAIALLKEQEAVEPQKKSDGNPQPWSTWCYVCGECGQEIDYHDRYCRNCGRKVKWE